MRSTVPRKGSRRASLERESLIALAACISSSVYGSPSTVRRYQLTLSGSVMTASTSVPKRNAFCLSPNWSFGWSRFFSSVRSELLTSGLP